jgi:hypothetical protein
MDGWHDTPDQAGLFVTAERTAQTALQAAESASRAGNDLGAVKSDINLVIEATDPVDPSAEVQRPKVEYGVKNALTGAVQHIEFAAESRDASANIRSSAAAFSRHAVAVLDRCDLITGLGGDVLRADSSEVARLLADEILTLARANVYGEDSNGDGVVGSSPEEYGLMQLRAELESTIAREDPPYTTVERWYLFNLIRLPSGEWIFRQRSQGSSDGEYGGY